MAKVKGKCGWCKATIDQEPKSHITSTVENGKIVDTEVNKITCPKCGRGHTEVKGKYFSLNTELIMSDTSLYFNRLNFLNYAFQSLSFLICARE